MSEKKYWKGIEELRNDAEFVRLKNNEFFEHLPVDEKISRKAEANDVTPRRDFLKFMGFSVAAATLAACETPIVKSIPYIIKPEEITPGIANWYASTFWDGYDYCPVVVKTREGRPIKIEGNDKSLITGGGTSARVQASVLSLYDTARLKTPFANGAPASWENIDAAVSKKLADIAAKNGKIRILSSTIISPSTKKIIEEFTKKYPGTQHVTYDSISCSGIIKANKESFETAAIPSYRFDKADVIVSFGADFLANWISPIEFAGQYAAGRKLDNGKKKMSKHIQFEANLSLTGSNADKRYMMKPSQAGVAIANLYNAVARMTGAVTLNVPDAGELKNAIEDTAKQLVAAKGKSLVVAKSNMASVQNIVNGINVLLESYGSTINLAEPCMTRQGNDDAIKNLWKELIDGEVSALLIYNCNPCYTLPDADKFTTALKKVELTVSFSDRSDETAGNCHFICPDNHYLESWGDAEAKKGYYSFSQPTIAPLFSTRQFAESMLLWSGAGNNYHEYLKSFGENVNGWESKLKEGVHEMLSQESTAIKFMSEVLSASASIVSTMKSSGGLELILYEKTGIGNGNQANNPWLQELPDPVSKVTWDNYLCVSPKDAREKGWNNNNVVTLKANGVAMDVPVYVQPGQTPGTVALALGYGRKNCGKVADGVGVNAFAFSRITSEGIMYWSNCDVAKSTKDDYMLAATQLHHTMMGRKIVKETMLENFIRKSDSGNEELLIPIHDGEEKKKLSPDKVNLWDSFETPNHRWGMSIDLNSCIGCGACVVACTAENNVPVVGKDEIARSREMHWIRIDRYYTSDAAEGDLSAMEQPSDNPQVVFQPVMCQHCNHAPCETVCPVVATTHSSEGLNQMAYNRCIGTRYCANNCPYKVRRFNWFEYTTNSKFTDVNPSQSELGRMVLNPDVVVRARGVMEKCSMCIQRIQETKLNAKKESRKIADGEIKTACLQACPTHAITFGDYNIAGSEINKMWKPEERSYHLLEELDVQPNVFYQTKVRNTEAGEKHES
ncbi:MAG TPA: TAT-variant-translocated molybdopterin oxidoreductase [Bacteroidia bacterium]|nr:TAT-variant-translocated molybdopterin oxidoreductase [Bacteroidia bacterium]